MSKKVSFKLAYSALKMFGKQLYSNVGAAISELVANGFDAGADDVYVVIDARNKSAATVEILDNGGGMSPEHIQENYVKIGYNKRNKEENPDKAMGRKGIGKLAALYMSDKFVLLSKTAEGDFSAWELDVAKIENEDAAPDLERIDDINIEHTECYSIWQKQTKGTFIYLENVDLGGFGKRGLESIQRRMSNYFLLDQINKRIHMMVILNDSAERKFELVKKQIAFKNMAYVYSDNIESFKELQENQYSLEYANKLKQIQKYIGTTQVKKLGEAKEGFEITGEITVDGVTKPYCLSGWMGVHCTIDEDKAKENDSSYFKSTFYNPNQIRLYVRGKLAVANMREHLGIKQAFANYIEGEVSFDILDDNDMPDVATAGRQDYDIADPRFVKLCELLKVVADSLVRNRQALADKLKEERNASDMKISTAAKQNFASKFSETVETLPIPNEEKTELINTTINQIEGEVEVKGQYTIFISHSGQDRFLSDFFYNYLVKCGYNGNMKDLDNCEIFYSSAGMDKDTMKSLSKTIRDFLVAKDNDVLMITSSGYNDSEFCMFEGGAVWATKADKHRLIAIDYDTIPSFLKNGSPEICFSDKMSGSYIFNRQLYNDIVVILRRAMTHLNQNKKIRGEEEVVLPEVVEFPDDVELKKSGKKIDDYMDPLICEYWNTYVLENVDAYIKFRKGKRQLQLQIEALEASFWEKYNQTEE